MNTDPEDEMPRKAGGEESRKGGRYGHHQGNNLVLEVSPEGGKQWLEIRWCRAQTIACKNNFLRTYCVGHRVRR